MKKLTKNGLFATPESQENLIDWIERLSGGEKIVAYTVMGMTWNLCSKLVSEDSEEPQEA